MSEQPKTGSITTRALRALWRLFAIGFAVVAVLLALAVGLFRVLVPMVPDYHQRIEAAASSALGYPVKFERIDARWRLRGPELVFEGATVFDGESRNILVKAEDGYVNLSVAAFIGNRQIVPDSILLRGVDLELVRNEQGEFEVFGHRQPGGRPKVSSARQTWPLPNGRFELRDARLRYVDGDAEPLVIPDLELNIEIDGRHLRLDGKITPPVSMGDEIELSAELDGTLANIEAAEWQVYVAGSDIDLAAIASLIGAAAPVVTAGHGDAVLWAGFVGTRLRNASLEVDVADLQLGVLDKRSPYDRVRGRFEWDKTDAGWRGIAHGLYVSRAGKIWPHVDLKLTMEPGEDGVGVVRLQAPFVRLEDVAPVLVGLPDSAVTNYLRSLDAVGELYDLELMARLDAGMPTVYSVDARMNELGWADHGALPGVRGLSGTLRADQLGGRLEVDSEVVTIHAPSLLRSDLEAWRLAGTIVWRESDDGWQVISDRVLLATEDFDALSRFTLRFDEGSAAPHVDLDIELGNVDVARTRSYLPVPVMKPKLVDWLNMALQGGTITSASLNLHGPLDRFPFDDDSGSFSAHLEAEDVTLAFAHDWPLAKNVNAVVDFDGRSLDAHILAGGVGDVGLQSGRVRIADLKVPVLDVQLRSRSDLESIVGYFLTTPASLKFTDLLTPMHPTGPTVADFTLTMPLREWRSFDYRLYLDLDGATLAYSDWRFQLEAMTGQLTLSPQNIRSDGLGALLLGRPVDIVLHTEHTEFDTADGPQPVSTVVADAHGRADANVLSERLFEPISRYLSGSSDWSAQIRFPPFGFGDRLPLEVTFASQLDGMAVTLPMPLAKVAEEANRPLRAALSFADPDNCAVELAYGDDILANMEWQRMDGEWGVRRGELAIGGARPVLSQRPGVSIVGNVQGFDLSEWLAQRTRGGPPLTSLLRTVDVKVDELRALGQTIADAHIKVDRNVREWLIEIESESADGAIFYPFDPGDGTPVIVNMQRLHWRSGGGGKPTDPRTLPALRVDVQDFVFNSWHFGSLAMALDPVEDGLSLQRFATTDASFTGSASGVWRHADARPSQFRMLLESSDMQATAARLNVVEAIEADVASMELELFWDEHLDENIVSEAYGIVAIRIGDGRLVTVDPKAGRVFGLLSITALPRRLSLDFSDIFNKGFAFDSIKGDFVVRNGSAYTENLMLRGPAAQVGVVGRAGIADRDYDQTAVVYASFGPSLPIAGAIAGGPAVGAALLIFSELFKDPLKQIGRVDYRITGSWDEPNIVRVATSGGAGEEAPADATPSKPVARNEDSRPTG